MSGHQNNLRVAYHTECSVESQWPHMHQNSTNRNEIQAKLSSSHHNENLAAWHWVWLHLLGGKSDTQKMRTSQPAVGQTYKMQACVGKEKALSRNQIPGHTCSPSMSITLPRDLNDLLKLWPLQIFWERIWFRTQTPSSKSLPRRKLTNVFSFSWPPGCCFF